MKELTEKERAEYMRLHSLICQKMQEFNALIDVQPRDPCDHIRYICFSCRKMDMNNMCFFSPWMGRQYPLCPDCAFYCYECKEYYDKERKHNCKTRVRRCADVMEHYNHTCEDESYSCVERWLASFVLWKQDWDSCVYDGPWWLLVMPPLLIFAVIYVLVFC